MLTFRRLIPTLLLGLSLVACGASGPVDGDPIFSDDLPNPEAEPAALTGEYAVSTHFEVSAASLGFERDLTRMANDPADYVASLITENLGSFDLLVQPLVEEGIDKVMSEQVKGNLQRFARDLKGISVEFDVLSTLTIGNTTSASHRATGMNVEIDAEEYAYSFDDDALQAATSALTVTSSQIRFAKHDMAIPYEQMLTQVINDVLVPRLDPNATTLGNALARAIDCDSVAYDIVLRYPTIGWAENIISSGCEGGATAFGDNVLDIVGVELATVVSLEGPASFSDANQDGRIDRLQGKWKSVLFGQNINAEFSAERVR